jgi:molybdopterin synthase catalytic subunit
MKRVSVQATDFNAGAELAHLNIAGVGGVGSFIGVVRGGEGLAALELEHYPQMTERALGAIADQALARWDLLGCTVIHRFGRLLPGENIVFVAAASAHRGHALAASGFLIDWLKTSAPFWKREIFDDGAVRWVEAKGADQEIAQSWTK